MKEIFEPTASGKAISAPKRNRNDYMAASEFQLKEGLTHHYHIQQKT